MSLNCKKNSSQFKLFFLWNERVDDVVIRIFDTRIHHESGNLYLIREYTEKESLVKDLLDSNCSMRLLTEPNELSSILEVKKEMIEKLKFPNK